MRIVWRGRNDVGIVSRTLFRWWDNAAFPQRFRCFTAHKACCCCWYYWTPQLLLFTIVLIAFALAERRFGASAQWIAAKFHIDAWTGLTRPNTHEDHRWESGRFHENTCQRQRFHSGGGTKEEIERYPGSVQSRQGIRWRQGAIGHSNIWIGGQAHSTTGLGFGAFWRWNSRQNLATGCRQARGTSQQT